jgi:hypothetical protein
MYIISKLVASLFWQIYCLIKITVWILLDIYRSSSIVTFYNEMSNFSKKYSTAVHLKKFIRYFCLSLSYTAKKIITHLLNNQCSWTNGDPFQISIEKKKLKISMGLDLRFSHLTILQLHLNTWVLVEIRKNGVPLKVKIKELISLNIKSG